MPAQGQASGARYFWNVYLQDAQALQRLRGPAYQVTSPEDGALGRAAVVALAAAFQRFVAELFVVSLEAMQLAGVEEREDETRYARGDFGNPSPAGINSLFGRIFAYDGICNLLNDDEWSLVDDHVRDRHEVAHGRDAEDGQHRRHFEVLDLQERIAGFEDVVRSLDRRASALVEKYGGTAW